MRTQTQSVTHITWLLIIGVFLASCEAITREECAKGDYEAMVKIGEGDFQTYKKFMAKHKDPAYCCSIQNSGYFIDQSVPCLSGYVQTCGSIEIIKDYFSYSISQEQKNSFVVSYSQKNSDEILSFLVRQGGKFDDVKTTFKFFTSSPLRNLHRVGYDFTYTDPRSGNNLFLDYSACVPKDSSSRSKVIECLSYLDSINVNTQLKNKEGKTALDLATDSLIIDYLKKL